MRVRQKHLIKLQLHHKVKLAINKKMIVIAICKKERWYLKEETD